LDPVHPTSHVYAKMALNLIEKVANPGNKVESRKRKRSEDSGSGSGSQYGTVPQAPRPSSQVKRGPPSNKQQGGSQYGCNRDGSQRTFSVQNRGRSGSDYSGGSRGFYGIGSGYGPGYGSGQVGGRQNDGYGSGYGYGSGHSGSGRFDGAGGERFNSSPGGNLGGRGRGRGRPWVRR